VAGECAHCGLPLGRRPVRGTVDGAAHGFCCYGCLLALQITRRRGEEGAAAAILVRLGLAVFFTINVMMVSVPTYAPYVYGVAGSTGDGALFQVLRVLAMVLAAPVLVLLGVPILASAWQGLRAGLPNADVLIILGTFAAYGLSVVNILAGRPGVYFDTATMLLVLVTLGRYLEASAKAEAGAAVRARLAPAPALAARVGAHGIERVAPAALLPGDVAQVGPGEAFPTDGVIVEGAGGVDEAALTGESRPVRKAPGARVASGTCSVDGVFRVRVGARAAESAAARVQTLLAAARRERAAVERLADRAGRIVVPLVIVVAAGAALFWSARLGLERGLLVGLAVLVVACPCAFGIATPVALWTALTTAGRRGVIVRSAPVLERAAAVGRVFFDKTGTLTTATPRLVAVELAPGVGVSARVLLARAAALESGLGHPLARAIEAAWRAREDGAPAPRASDVRVVPGRGVRGRVEGVAVAVGGRDLAADEIGTAPELPPAPAGTSAAAAETAVFVVEAGRLLGVLRLAEAPRPEAAAALAALRRLGIGVGLLTGDATAAAVVPALVSEEDAALGLRPDDKVARIRRAGASSRPAAGSTGARARRAVAMVGDGVNDAPALAAADLGIAVASASDLTRVTADVAVLCDDLTAVPWLLGYARRVTRVVRQNLAWAFAYNAAAVVLAAAGVLNPVVAAVAMLGSSLGVVANARRLRRAGSGVAPAVTRAPRRAPRSHAASHPDPTTRTSSGRGTPSSARARSGARAFAKS
jgi:P-type Cu2+ transporter